MWGDGGGWPPTRTCLCVVLYRHVFSVLVGRFPVLRGSSFRSPPLSRPPAPPTMNEARPLWSPSLGGRRRPRLPEASDELNWPQLFRAIAQKLPHARLSTRPARCMYPHSQGRKAPEKPPRKYAGALVVVDDVPHSRCIMMMTEVHFRLRTLFHEVADAWMGSLQRRERVVQRHDADRRIHRCDDGARR